jgi:beta-glucanase (GH16 family)
MAPRLNDELQRYVDSSNQTLKLQDGVLRLIATSDHRGAIVSARISTFGLFSFTYGVVEARMRVP